MLEMPERPAAKEPGRLSRAFARLWMKRATVTANEQLAGRFHLITLEGPALQRVAWLPGQKVQIAMGSAFVTRTYTPIEWNAFTGQTRILGYAHGDGPGSSWVRTVAPGDECDVFGPRASLDTGRLAGPLVIMGDETSIGLICAAVRQDGTRLVTSCLEVEDIEAARQVTARLGLEHVTLVPRSGNALDAALSAGIAAGASFALSGSAPTIQRLRQSLKQQSIPAARLATKAYWAPGKTGLD